MLNFVENYYEVTERNKELLRQKLIGNPKPAQVCLQLMVYLKQNNIKSQLM